MGGYGLLQHGQSKAIAVSSGINNFWEKVVEEIKAESHTAECDPFRGQLGQWERAARAAER